MVPGLPRRARLVGFFLLAVLSVPAGAGITSRIDRTLHVSPFAPEHTTYYPLALALVRVAVALAVAWLVTRIVRAQRRVSAFSVRVWAASFAVASTSYLVAAASVGAVPDGRWPLVAPLLHTFALPVFALLSVLLALAWGVLGWVRDFEDRAVRALARAGRMLVALRVSQPRSPRLVDESAPRRRFGLAFESRPPPLPA